MSSQQSREGMTFLNAHEAATTEAIAERIVPSTDGQAGARQADCVVYIDRNLSGFRRDLQSVFRRGLRGLDELCDQHMRAPFVRLEATHQDAVLRVILDGPNPHGWSVADEVSRAVVIARDQTIEGFFCDPAYGGNRDMVGWKMVGFPGAQWGYSPDDMALDADLSHVPVQTIAGLLASIKTEGIQ